MAANAANHVSIKVSTDLVEEARQEAGVVHRSVGAQVEYWARLGQAIERTPGFDVDTVKQAMTGRLRLDVLPTGEARGRLLRQVAAEFDAPDAATRNYYAELGRREGAVGTDGKGGVVHRQPNASARR
jgi:hypothetical protein